MVRELGTQKLELDTPPTVMPKHEQQETEYAVEMNPNPKQESQQYDMCEELEAI